MSRAETIMRSTGARLLAGWLFGTAVASGCAPAPPAHPEQMSAADHRRAAAEEEQKALTEEGKAPTTTAISVGLPVVANINADATELGEIQNQGSGQVEVASGSSKEARALRRHAQGHLRAAAELEQFTDSKCEDVPKSARTGSPLADKLSAVEDVDKGVRLVLKPGVDAPKLLAALRCHRAFARERNYEGGDECPLYLPKLILLLEPGNKAVRMTTTESSYVSALRSRSRHFLKTGTAHP